MNRNEEILTILQEECAEVIQAVSKVRRLECQKITVLWSRSWVTYRQ
jgi:NTP pyrophosphatase (non-canonical NTP hydrolase)